MEDGLVTVIQNITSSPWGNSDYLICNRKTDTAIAVDPWDIGQLSKLAETDGYKISAIFITHTHRDHIAGTQAYLSSLTNMADSVPIFCHEMAKSQIAGAQLRKAGDEFWAGLIRVIETPGHRPEHISLFIPQAIWRRNSPSVGLSEPSASFSPVIIAGDCLFDSGVGNCTNGGDPAILFETVSNTLMKLKKTTLVFAGHDYRIRNLEFALSIEPLNKDIQKALSSKSSAPSNIQEQLKLNPFFRFDHPDVRAHLAQRELPHETSKERFCSLRELRDRW
jgi:hydroxyacylglutathione hydrolase